MKTAKELVDEINTADICSPHYIDDEIDFSDVAQVARINLDEYRWYVIGTIVYKIGDEFIGVRGPVSLKSESMGYNDLDIIFYAFEMEAVPSVTYRRKGPPQPTTGSKESRVK